MNKMINLFAGAGGCALGLQRAGFEPAGFCDADPDCRLVLSKNWPNVPVFDDVRTLTKDDINDKIDLVSGGFPCQDLSNARTGSGLGLGEGLDGARSGLWFEQARIISELEPTFVIGENVSALLGKGLDRILSSLDEIGYDAEWHCIPASHVGAPQQRDRIWIVAYARSEGLSGPLIKGDTLPLAARTEIAQLGDIAIPCGGHWGGHSPSLRMDHGFPPEPHRLKQLGNSCVPVIPEAIGRALLLARKTRLRSAPSNHFWDALHRATYQLKRPLGCAINLMPPAAYETADCFLTGDSKSGFALLNGELTGLFSVPKGRGAFLINAAIERGAHELNCFEGYLSDLYGRHGFRETTRTPWDTAQAPRNWDVTRWGTPDVLTMSL